MTDSIQKFSSVIIGTGFAGIAMAIKMLEQGHNDFIILERGDSVGGTWRDNRYPGAACDVPSALYSLSFEQNADWSRSYPSQPELHDYLCAIAEKYQLVDRIRFNQDMQRMEWDEEQLGWHIETSNGQFFGHTVVAGTGGLAEPKVAEINGAETFSGEQFHSAKWNHDYDLAGKRIAVIGTGASAIQFVPQLAKQAGRLDVYQRTPNWIIPRADHPIGKRQKWLLHNVKAFQQLKRLYTYLKHEAVVLGIVINPALMVLLKLSALRHMKKQVPDVALRKAMTPSYTIGCKRVLISNDWYPAISQSNVDLITTGIQEIRSNSVVTSDGSEREIDAIVWGTGFYATENPIADKIIGSNGQKLSEAWANGEYAYKGTAIHGYPNLFFIVGPNTTVGHTSMVLMIEAQVNYIRKAMQWQRNNNIKRLEISRAAETQFNEGLQDRLAGSVWATGCSSWYKHKSGKITALWPGFTFNFIKILKEFDSESYEAS